MILRTLVTLAAVFAMWQTTCGAIFTETWEMPAITTAGGTTTSLPTGWNRFSGSTSDSVLVRPTTATFDMAGPLESPAGGNQALRLAGTNVGIAYVTTEAIQASTIYTLQAAIGNDVYNTPRNDSWSLQLWADTNSNGIFDGSLSDTFIGQQFGTNPGAVNPIAGEWALNVFSFDSSSIPSLVGKRLVIFLNNYNVTPDVGRSYYDNVELSSAQPVPEPASLAIWGLGALGCAVATYRRRPNAA